MSAPKKKTRAPHPPGCPCPPCNPRHGRTTKLVRVPLELVEWATERGGVAEVLRQAREASPA